MYKLMRCYVLYATEQAQFDLLILSSALLLFDLFQLPLLSEILHTELQIVLLAQCVCLSACPYVTTRDRLKGF